MIRLIYVIATSGLIVVLAPKVLAATHRAEIANAAIGTAAIVGMAVAVVQRVRWLLR